MGRHKGRKSRKARGTADGPALVQPLGSSLRGPTDAMLATPDTERSPIRASSAADAWDPATGLPGPAFWGILLEAEAARAARYLRPVTLALVEVGWHWPRSAGPDHDVPPEAVDHVAVILRDSCRSSDHVARLGPTRLGVLLSETGEIAAINFIERVRDRTARELSLPEGAAVVFGWASPSPGAGPAAWSALAEERLRDDARTLAALD
jgi:GGDEF domain-containing protein